MSLRTQALKGLKWSAALQWGTQAVSFVTLLVLARLLGPEALGLMAIVGAVLALTRVFVDQGFTSAIVQRQTLEPPHLDTAFWTSAGLGAVASALLWALSNPLSALYGESELAELLQSISVIPLIASAASTQMAILRREMNFKALALRGITAATIGAVTGVSMALLGFGIWSLVGQQVAMVAAGSVLIWLVTPWRPTFSFSVRHFKQLWSFGIHILGFDLLGNLNRRADTLLVGYFLSPTAVGYYSVGKHTTRTIQDSLTQAVGQVALPAFSRMQGDNARLRTAFYSATRFVSLLTFPAFAFLALMSAEIVKVVLGVEWSPTSPVLAILAVGGFFGSIVWFTGTVMLAKGRSGLRLLIGLAATIAGLLAILISYPHGIEAIALSLVVRSFLFLPVRYAMTHRLIQLCVKDYFSSLRPALLATAGLSLSVLAIDTLTEQLEPVFRLFIAIPAGIACYLTLLVVFERQVILHARSLFATATGRSTAR
jgi:PST family polysaccharide transporter